MINRTMNARNGEGRIGVMLYLDPKRHDRLGQLVAAYGAKIGRPVSWSLIMQRALDLLQERLDALDNPTDILTERMAILGPARCPLQKTTGDD